MGLDMYLYARKHESCYNRYGEEPRIPEYPVELKGCEYPMDERGIYTQTDYAVGYWRKQNAIHRYFVDECANGVDECQEIQVSLEKLKDLKDKCEKVLDDHTLAQTLLPTQGGFFFGDTSYDEWYIRGLQETVKIISPLITLLEQDRENGNWSVIYQASW